MAVGQNRSVDLSALLNLATELRKRAKHFTVESRYILADRFEALVKSNQQMAGTSFVPCDELREFVAELGDPSYRSVGVTEPMVQAGVEALRVSGVYEIGDGRFPGGRSLVTEIFHAMIDAQERR